MTHEEIREACAKFTNYLQANGVKVDAHMVMFNGDMVVGSGNREKAQMMVVAAAADMMGYKLEPL